MSYAYNFIIALHDMILNIKQSQDAQFFHP